MLSPQTMLRAQGITWPSMVVNSFTPATSHELPTGRRGSMAPPSDNAPPPFSAPAPCVRVSYCAPLASAIAKADAISIAFTVFGDGLTPNRCLLDSISSATVPEVTAAAMLVPLR